MRSSVSIVQRAVVGDPLQRIAVELRGRTLEHALVESSFAKRREQRGVPRRRPSRCSNPSSSNVLSARASTSPAASASSTRRLYIAVALRTAWCQYTFRYIWYFANRSDSSADSPFSSTPMTRRPCRRLVDEHERIQQPVDVDLAVRHAAHQRVALEVFDLVEIERSRHEALQRRVARTANEREHSLRRALARAST